MGYQGLIAAYHDYLPVRDIAHAVSLFEGNTPLIRLRNMPRLADADIEAYVKYEGLNPTGSFKDRGMTVAVTDAIERGNKAIVCASTGNTSASAAAYAARAGIKAFVLIPDGKIALGKLAQAMIEGAVVVRIEGNFDQGMELVKEISAGSDIVLVNSVNPYRLQGQKTAAFEIIERLGDAPDYHYLPVGNAGNISAYWMGYSEASGADSFCIDQARAALGDAYKVGNRITATRRPRMMGYQAEGAAPIVLGHKVARPETVATAIRIGNPQSWEMARAAQRESQGKIAACSDDKILSAQRMLAECEGIFCEPASAASLAGLLEDAGRGELPPGSIVVCTLTGHGLKDPDTAISQTADGIEPVAAELGPINDLIASHL